MLESASLGADDRAALERALALEPDALVVNETAYAAGWREIAAEARGFEAARRREPIEWRVRPRS